MAEVAEDTSGVLVWLSILVPSAIVGIVCAVFISAKRGGYFISAAIPWFGLLAWLLYNEYFVPYQGGGASMWPIAQLVAGTIAAMTGAAWYSVAQIALRRNRHQDDKTNPFD